MMVDTQVRPSDVTKFQIIDAMLGGLAKPMCLSQARTAYMGENLALDSDHVMDPEH